MIYNGHKHNVKMYLVSHLSKYKQRVCNIRNTSVIYLYTLSISVSLNLTEIYQYMCYN